MQLAFDDVALGKLAQTLGLRLVVLFGSVARGRAALGSDLDIAVLGMPEAQYWEGFEALQGVFPDRTLDLVRLEDADPLFRQEMMHRGILLWGDPVLFAEYRAYAYRDYTDSADLFALERLLFDRKMKRLKGQIGDSR